MTTTCVSRMPDSSSGTAHAPVRLSLAEEAPEDLARLVGEARERPAEHELPHPRRIRRGVDDRHEAARGVAEEVDRLEAEMRTKLVEIRRVVLEPVRLGRVGVAHAARIELDQRPVPVEAARSTVEGSPTTSSATARCWSAIPAGPESRL
jgi:hypothetical protein